MYFKRLIDRFRSTFTRHTDQGHSIVSRGKHGLSRKKISDNALKVLYRLKKSGFSAYLVGGGVRDLLLKQPTKDFDVVTNARPNQIRKLFSNSRIIGRRFRLVHVLFRHEIIEVSTFRAMKAVDADDDNLSDNTFGSLEEDAWRRDFTINALFYNIEDFSIVDYTGGFSDLNSKTVRVIGDPLVRAQEDPVRLLRALRFAAKLNFRLEEQLDSVLRAESGLIRQVPSARLLHECEKLFCSGYACSVFDILKQYGYLKYFFSEEVVGHIESGPGSSLVRASLRAADKRYAKKEPLNMGFILAVFLWPAIEARVAVEGNQHKRFYQALHVSIGVVVRDQLAALMIPKRLLSMMKSMWLLQYNFERRRPRRIKSLLSHRYFRAAFDLLKLRSGQSPHLKKLASWWETAHLSAEKKTDIMIAELEQRPSVKRKKS